MLSRDENVHPAGGAGSLIGDHSPSFGIRTSAFVRQRILVATIAAAVAAAAAVDFSTSTRLIGSILFTLPLALCALQSSRRILLATLAASVALTAAAGWWGFFRAGTAESLDGWVSRGLLIASLVTLAAFIMSAARARARGRASDQRFQHLLAANKEYALFTLDAAGRVATWNIGAEQLKGYGADEILGEHFSRFYTPEDVAAGTPQSELIAAARSGRSENQGWRIRKDGSRFWADVVISALRDEAGVLLGFAKLTRDVTARKDAEERLLSMEHRYSALLESAPDGIVISDGNSRILMVNAETERLFGYARHDLIGQSVDILVPERFRGRHPRHRSQYAAAPQTRAMGAGRTLLGLRLDGSEFPVEISLSPTETTDGTLVTSAIRDVTARKAAEEMQRLDEERHRMAVEVAQMGTWTWKIESDEITWSDEFRALFGLSTNAVLTYDEITRHIHPDDRDRLDEAVKQTLERGSPYDIEYRIVWPDSSIHWLSSRGRVRRNAAGEPIDMRGVIMDVTDRKQAQEVLQQRLAQEQRTAELLRSNAELQQFAYVAAHDLQEPLRMVASYTQLIAQRYRGKLDADADEFIAYAVDGARRMQMLIADLLAYCRVETAGQGLVETSSSEALEAALDNLAGAISESNAVVTRDPLPSLAADQFQLIQLFQNLVGNALKYRSTERPRIHVSVKRGGPNEWIFSVRDNGIGIDPKYADKIFLMFQRLHGRDEFPGTGIGLTLCKKIAERHGGRIWLAANVGVGSTFHVALPERVIP